MNGPKEIWIVIIIGNNMKITLKQLRKLLTESNIEVWENVWKALQKFHKDVELRIPRYSYETFIDVHNVPEDVDIDEFADKILSICRENGIDDMHIAGSTPLHYKVGTDYRDETASWFRLLSDKF